MTNNSRFVAWKNSIADLSKPLSIVDKAALFLLSVCPVLQHYKGIFINAAVTVLLLLFPYVFWKIIKKDSLNVKGIKIVFPLIAFYLFQVVDHGTSVTEAGQAVVFIIYVTAISAGCFDTNLFIRMLTAVSAAACVCIIAQYFCYYFLGFHLQLVPTSLLLPRCRQWILLAQTGRYSITGKLMKFYRPSAFFLEPSHMFIYLFTPATLRLLCAEKKKELLTAFLLLLGMVLSTSGMGILTALMLFFLHLGKTQAKKKGFSATRLLKPANLLITLAFIAACLFAYFKIPFVHHSVARILSSGEDYSNAVEGRISSGWNLIKTLRGKQILIGVQDGMSGVTASMSGFNETLYQYGLIGLLISYVFYVQGLFRLRNGFFWVAFFTIMLSFFSQHTHSTMFMISSTFVFVEGYQRLRDHRKEKNIHLLS